MIQSEWLDFAESWMQKARSDLDAARILIFGAEKHLDVGVFHCQQAAEKSLKAWLTANGAFFPKTHELERLLKDCVKYDEAFEKFREDAELLTPLATEFRYPGDFAEPEISDAIIAHQKAEAPVSFASSKISGLTNTKDQESGK